MLNEIRDVEIFLKGTQKILLQNIFRSKLLQSLKSNLIPPGDIYLSMIFLNQPFIYENETTMGYLKT